MTSIASWARENVERFGDYPSIVVGDRVWRSTELDVAARRLASAFAALGVKPGAAVLVLLPARVETFLAAFAAWQVGGVFALAPASTSPRELALIVEHLAPSLLVTSAEFHARVAPQIGALQTLLVDGVAPATTSFWDVLRASEPLDTAVPRSALDPAQVSFTSGTSGIPKGVIYSHGALGQMMRISAEQLAADSSSTACELSALPLGSFTGSIIRNRLVGGHKLVLTSELDFDPPSLLKEIERHQVTTLVLVPSQCQALVSLAVEKPRDTSSVRAIRVSGSHLAPQLAQRVEAMFGVRPSTTYGMTETWLITRSAADCSIESAGRVVRGVEVRIVNEEGVAVPPGSVGEIRVRAPWQSSGYLGENEDAAKTFVDGWVATGDLGHLGENGELFLVGRSKELIVQSGVNVYPREVVNVVSQVPGVAECGVVGIPNDFLGEEVAVAIVCKPGSVLSDDDVLFLCREQLDPRKIPLQVDFVSHIPRNALGKVQAGALRELILEARRARSGRSLVDVSNSADPAELRETLRKSVVQALRRSLPRDSQVDEAVSFGDLGLDSIGAARFAGLLGADLGRPLAPTLAFNYPTVGRVVAHLEEMLFPTRAEVVPGPPQPHRRQATSHTSDAIAIVGWGLRLPGGVTNADQFWALLRAGVDATDEIRRWDLSGIYDPVRGTPGKSYVRRAALIDDAAGFDAEFFGFSTSEAVNLDPQHRIVLEVTWEALEHAGVAPKSVSERLAGLFLGIGSSGYPTDDHFGGMPAMAVGRVAHFLDLRGPVLTIDTTCSSSLVAIHEAVRALRLGDANLAIAGGVKIQGSMKTFISLSALQAVAPDGRSKTFDARADGFGRGEGCVMLVLQRLDDAVRERRTIHGVIRGTAINHDGRSTSLTAPNRRAQEEVGRAALADAQARPDDVVYLETHGTGTVLGDPIEIEAAMSVYAEKSEPLVVGALKANIGHLEAAAGAAGVVKAALVLTNEVVPPQLHLRDLNPMLLPHASRIVIPRSESRLPRGPTQKPMASVMAMGMTGTNAYAVLEAPPPTASPREGSHAPSVLCLSARSARALDELSRAYAKHLHTLPEDRLEDVAFTACVGRTHFAHRLAVSSTSLGTLASELERHAEGKPSSVRRGRSEGPKRPLAFLFTGQGSQYVGMGADLYAAEPVFRAEIDRCSDALAPVLRRSVRDALFEATAEGQPGLDDTAMTQPALFAFEWAMTRLWAARGVVPDIVLGHSFGELVAMCVAGMLELEDALRLVAVRGALMSALPQGGAMYALATSAERAERAIVDLGADAEIAALNGPLSTVIAGSELGVSHVAQVLLAEGVQVKRLVVSAAFHSRQMDPMLADFVSLAGKLTVSEPRRAVVSAVLGRRLAAADVDLAYWRQSIRSPVRFRAGVAAVVAEGARTFVEVGPHPALLGMARECVEDADANTWIASARRKRPAREQLAEACADLYVSGVEPRWETLFEGIPARFTPLPTYQFQHRAYWVGDPTSPRRDETEDGVERSPSGVVLAMDREARRAHIATFLRETVALLISSGDDTVAIDVNLIDAGLDSLRATQLVSRIRTGLGVVVTPGDVAAAATISGLCSRVDGLLDVKGAASGSTAASPLVTIRAEGVKTPIFCMHPAGGQVSPYLRLRTLLDGVPIYAFQSRAVASALPEHATLAAMAEEYARAVADSRPTGPVRLLGWSMGGVVAHAVASVLESRGRVVELVAMIDSPPAGGHAALLDETRLCLSGVVFDATPEPPTREALQKAFESLPNETERWRAHLEASGVLRVGAHTHATFDAALRLYRTHLELVREHEPSVIAAPLLVWWADSPLRTAGRVWGERTRGGYRESTVGGDHFSVVKSPLIERIIREMESWSTP